MMKPFNLKNPVHLLATGFGSGLAPFAPGTFGTLAAIPFFYLFHAYLSEQGYIIMLVISALAGIYICGKTAKDCGVHDHGSIVWDEFVGLWLTLLFIPSPHWLWVVIGFVYFRFFDIIKPFPIGLIDKRVKGGFGIMVDDVIAGFFAFVCLQMTAQVYLYLQAHS